MTFPLVLETSFKEGCGLHHSVAVKLSEEPKEDSRKKSHSGRPNEPSHHYPEGEILPSGESTTCFSLLF